MIDQLQAIDGIRELYPTLSTIKRLARLALGNIPNDVRAYRVCNNYESIRFLANDGTTTVVDIEKWAFPIRSNGLNRLGGITLRMAFDRNANFLFYGSCFRHEK